MEVTAECFEEGVFFSNLLTSAKWTGRGPKVDTRECWGTGQVISDRGSW